MKLVVNCGNLEIAKKMIELNVEKIRVGIKDFSAQFNDYFTLNDLKKLISIKNKTLISVSLNIFYHENDLEKLEKLIYDLSCLDIDELSFHDFAIPQICFENNYKFNLHYNPETLNTNYEQIMFYQKNNINSFFLAREINLNELKLILENKNNASLEIQGHGFTFFMYSYWPLISNFDKSLIKEENEKYIIIKEKERKNFNLLREEKSGTYMYSGFILCLIKKIKWLIDNKLDFLLINPIFKDFDWTVEVVKCYKSIINNPTSSNIEEAYRKLSSIETTFPLSESFLGGIKSMLHMEKEINE